MDVLNNPKSNVTRAVLLVLVLLALFFAVKTMAEIKSYKFIGGGAPATNTISFSGEGEVSAAPDLAEINLTIREEAKEVKAAQDLATAKETKVLEFLEKSGIADKDIKTEGYNSYPKYDYGTPCYAAYCPRRTPTIIGYEVSETISVKVRDLAKAGEVLAGIGATGVSEISGPNFTIEKEEELKAEARKQAIEEAKTKAQALADDLGVRLVRIVNFSENGNYPLPYTYAKSEMAMDVAGSAPRAPELPQGETKITSNVVITYEIR